MVNPKHYFPLGSTIQNPPGNDYLVSSFFENYGMMSGNPVDGTLVMFYRKGNTNLGLNDFGTIFLRLSKDGGETWTLEWPLALPGNPLDYRFLAGGFTRDGRLYIFFTVCDVSGATAVNHGICYIYSDQNGLAGTFHPPQPLWTTYPIYPYKYLAYGHIVDIDIPTSYSFPPGGWFLSRHLYQTYEMQLDDYWYLYIADFVYAGAGNVAGHIGDILVYQGTRQLVRPTMVDLGGGFLLIFAEEKNLPGQYCSFLSDDYGLTWNIHGTNVILTTLMPATSTPCFLSYVNYQGVGLIVCSFFDHTGPIPTIKCAYAVAGDYILSLNPQLLWNIIGSIPAICTPVLPYTVTPFGDFGGPCFPSLFHPLNQFKGVGVCFYCDSTNPPPGTVWSWPMVFIPDSHLIISRLSSLLP